MQHDHEQGTPCGSKCPNRVANLARSTEMRCATHRKINCPLELWVNGRSYSIE